MSRKLAVKKKKDMGFLSLLGDMGSVVDFVRPHETGYEPDVVRTALEGLQESFEADYKRVSELRDLLFGEETAAYGARCTSVFNRWEEEKGGPSVLSLLAHAWEYFGLPQDDALARAAVISAVLAEVPNEMQYHGNEHYRKVLFHLIRMLAVHDTLEGDDVIAFDPIDKIMLMIAATIHDLGHEGGDNLRDGIYTPGYMEQQSIDMAMPYYDELGVGRNCREVLQSLVFCTDITFFAGDNSPCVRMRRIYDYFFNDSGDNKVENFMIGKLRLFYDNKKMALMAMMLHEADIGTSAGLSYEQSIKETIDIIEERGLKSAGPRVLLAFLQEQLESGMKTECAKILFAPAMDVIMNQARQEFQQGRETFYEEAP